MRISRLKNYHNIIYLVTGVNLVIGYNKKKLVEMIEIEFFFK